MMPHERSLVEHMEGRPFALLGINCDGERETVQQAGFQDYMAWRNWWNGGSRDPLTALYNVHSFPTTFVLDANGVVRYRNLRGADLEHAAEKLVRELETQGPGK